MAVRSPRVVLERVASVRQEERMEIVEPALTSCRSRDSSAGRCPRSDSDKRRKVAEENKRLTERLNALEEAQGSPSERRTAPAAQEKRAMSASCSPKPAPTPAPRQAPKPTPKPDPKPAKGKAAYKKTPATAPNQEATALAPAPQEPVAGTSETVEDGWTTVSKKKKAPKTKAPERPAAKPAKTPPAKKKEGKAVDKGPRRSRGGRGGEGGNDRGVLPAPLRRPHH
ncbi:alpha carbonic anhydrase 8-like [Trichoplusia ni]|uniref:Alpha carbonic anhydrase 8-like n=1 Tax=Trichoplusia ni TaxID=7111 RepID=A0A7E5X0E0_TRINI|nr:alpha carbonic anhydrase 8-like [Trichoplusia ni]